MPMEDKISRERMREKWGGASFLLVRVSVWMLVLLSAVPPVAAKPANDLGKFPRLDAGDVHDEQSVADRLKVLAILRKLQAASFAKAGFKPGVVAIPSPKEPASPPPSRAWSSATDLAPSPASGSIPATVSDSTPRPTVKETKATDSMKTARDDSTASVTNTTAPTTYRTVSVTNITVSATNRTVSATNRTMSVTNRTMQARNRSLLPTNSSASATDRTEPAINRTTTTTDRTTSSKNGILFTVGQYDGRAMTESTPINSVSDVNNNVSSTLSPSSYSLLHTKTALTDTTTPQHTYPSPKRNTETQHVKLDHSSPTADTETDRSSTRGHSSQSSRTAENGDSGRDSFKEGEGSRHPVITSQEHSNQTTEESPLDVSLLFEGDIMLSAAEAEEVLHSGQNRRKRKVTYSKKKIWSLPIPYIFDQSPQYRLNSSERGMVQAAIAHLESLTCITFQQVNSTAPLRPILSFKKDAGCWSYVGKEHAFHFQEVSTGEGCFEFGTLLHELGHAIGFWHEHSRPDRDGFIRVHTDRVRLGEEFNFKVESWGELDNMNVPYDVGSIMHYGSTYFSRSGREVTVESLDPRLQRALGQRLEMSFYDVKLANLAYCSEICKDSKIQCQHEGYPDPKSCNRCRCPPGLTGVNCQKVAYSQEPACGGHLFVDQDQRYSISSPSHPWRYPANIACTWLIQTAPGRQIVLRVDPHHFMTHPDCSPYPTAVCHDYLEVKYNISFGYTGARYCCGSPPQEALRSSGNSMLILFRTRHSGQGGFLADITSESCGGCHPGPGVQPACRRQEQRQCVKEWNSTQYVTCPVYFRKSSPNCNTWVTKRKSRLAVCTSEVEYCCDGFQVHDGRCSPMPSEGHQGMHHAASNDINQNNKTTSVRPLNEGGTQPDTDTGNTDIGQDADSSWSAWSQWSACSKSCGGCGLQTRHRTCDIPIQCGGQSVSEDSRACNTQPCPEMLVYMCSTTRVKDFYCGWGKCYRRVVETGPCYSACCPGYTEMYGKCVWQKS